MQLWACSAYNSLIKILLFRANNSEPSTSYSRNNLFFWLYHAHKQFSGWSKQREGFSWDIARTKPFSNIPTALSDQSWWSFQLDLMASPGALSEHLTMSLCQTTSSKSTTEWIMHQVPSQFYHALSFPPSPHWKKAFTVQILASPKLGHLHLLLKRNAPFHTGVFCYAHQIQPLQTQEDSLTARAVSLPYKQERQFPSHTKDFYGIAANPCFLGI